MNQNWSITNNFNVDVHGFQGSFYCSEQTLEENKVLIVCGGSSGNFALTAKLAEIFCNQGFHVLAMAYVNAKGLPKHTVEAPVESAQNAVKWLSNNGFNKIAMYGISSGGEYALLAASLIPQITCVVAVSAPCAISQGDDGLRYKNTSCWSWNNNPVPYMKINYSLIKAIPVSLRHRELYTKHFYEKGMKNAPDNVWIPVEKINGAVLFLTVKEDSICPSSDFAKIAICRMKEHKFCFPYEHVDYKYGSHFLIPVANSKSIPFKVFAIERRYPKECAESRIDAFNKIIKWLKIW
ncbi:alpha/beta hydrolase family protein [Clostridium sporogenes]|uniref:Abhydrolase domain-containing 18 n=1 Tax=Clostridium botulinum TaxID=1491 RepID=A0A6M0SWQ0_CLOBO|nr:acyl-CoA thioester hydrolase/BAAT C-terminal domain-containing protein [Clostridium sporogenes]NFA59100.1 abhydrolase domain-containing 18 [Clostridium botulinum]NFI73054.1 abhydrolase domain-containing 18 [Clostridium sporogenes]NFL71296.1 abhydrolase domain-containing 18 [Clostridium sporogenes]NFM23094.1 abhydrolase domain-containing 18 [Clostridium sporogenes]NFP60466.1 abhydrolase domain-containing 18 [Clostridium sporogenes]